MFNSIPRAAWRAASSFQCLTSTGLAAVAPPQRQGPWQHGPVRQGRNTWTVQVEHGCEISPKQQGVVDMWGGVAYMTSLLRRLQAQTIPDEAPPVGQIHPFSKIAVTFRPIQRFWCPSGFRMSEKNVNIVCFLTGSTILNRLGMTAP